MTVAMASSTGAPLPSHFPDESSGLIVAPAPPPSAYASPHDEKYFSDLLSAIRSDVEQALPPIPDSHRSAFVASCASVVAARASRDAALKAKTAADGAGDDAAAKAAKEALDAADEALSRADDACVETARPVLESLRQRTGLPPTESGGSIRDDDEARGLLADLDPTLLARGAVLFNGTPAGLAEFCARGAEEDGLIAGLLGDAELMLRMLEAGGAKGGLYGPAMQNYAAIRAEAVEGDWVRVERPGPVADEETGSDDDAQEALERLALGTSLEHAVLIAEFGSDGAAFVDPVSRYRHYADAYTNGELDGTFAQRTAWEMRLISNCDAPDDQLAWGRAMLRTYRPDLVRLEDMKWRYCNIVHTDVVYRHPPFAEKTYQDIISGGGQCGPRAWFGRYACRCFGIPVWGCKQPGHAAMTHWTPDQGWVVCLIYGGFWDIAWWEDRSGNDFLLETQARERGEEYMGVLRLQWVADVLGEKKLDHMKGIADPNSFWRSLALCEKKILARSSGQVKVSLPGDVTEIKEVSTPAQLAQPFAARQHTISYANDGTVVIPATSCTKPEAPTEDVLFMDSFSGGTQLHHREDATVEYTLEGVSSTGTYTVSFQLCNVHSEEQPILLTTSSTSGKDLLAAVVSVAVPYTVGAWAYTDAVEVELAEGTNVISFTRKTPNFGLSIKDITIKKV